LASQSIVETSSKYDIILDDGLECEEDTNLLIPHVLSRRRTLSTTLWGQSMSPALRSDRSRHRCCLGYIFARSGETGLGPRFHNASSCEICSAQGLSSPEFGGLRNRHHCRNCGHSTCRAHSSGRHGLPQFGYATPQRICDVCKTFPLGYEARASRLLVITVGKKALVWNSRSLTSPSGTVGEWLGWAGIASLNSDGAESLCILGSQPGAPLEVCDMTEGCAVRHSIPVSRAAPSLADSVLWHLGRAGPLDQDSATTVAVSGAWLVALQREKGGGSSFKVLEVPSCSCLGHCIVKEDITTLAVQAAQSKKSPRNSLVSSFGSLTGSLPEGLVLGGTKGGAVMIWSVPCTAEKCEILCALEGHSDMVTCVCISADARLVCSGSKDRTVRLWRRERSHVAFQAESLVISEEHVFGNQTLCCHGTYLAYVRSPKPDSLEQCASIWNSSSSCWERDICSPGYSITHVALRGLLLVTSSSSCSSQEGWQTFENFGFWTSDACRVHLWHVPTGIPLREFTNPSSISWLLLSEIPEQPQREAPAILGDDDYDQGKDILITLDITGKLGVVYDVSTGHIDQVNEGQAKRLGVKVGSVICQIDDSPYSSSLLQQKSAGGTTFQITLKLPVNEGKSRRA